MAQRRYERWREAAEANRRRTLLLLVSPIAAALALLLLALVTLPLIALGASLLVGFVLAASLAWRDASAGRLKGLPVVSLSEAVSGDLVGEAAAQRARDVSASICDALGLDAPSVVVLDDPAPNALALGTRPGSVSVVLTSGLLEGFDRIAIEAVLAHELVHVRRLDTLPAGVSASLLRGGVLPFPGARRLARWLEGGDREVEADLAAAQVTRYPPGLVRAIETAASPDGTTLSSLPPRVRARTATLWLVPLAEPGEGRQGPAQIGAFGTGERLDALREL